MRRLDASVIIPAFEEEENILRTLDLLNELKGVDFETIIVVDDANDSTISVVEELAKVGFPLKIVVQNLGKGPANAIRYGIESANSECVLVMMADGSDDVQVIPELINLVNRGVAVASASRYMSGGQQIGGPRIKKFLSKLAGKILFVFAGVGTHDPTNSFKAYSRSFISEVGIESRSGFEIGIELISKARRTRLPIAEIPTIWLDRSNGTSNFHLTKWIPKYLYWFVRCFGPAYKSNRKTDKEYL